MNWKRYNLVFLCLFTSVFAVARQNDTITVSLDCLLELGMKRNLSVRSERFAVKIAQNKREIAEQNQFPDIMADAGVGWARNSLSPHSYWSQSYGIRMIQPVYHGGKIGAALKSARIGQDIAELQYRQSEEEMKFILLEKYYKLICEYAKKDILIHNILQSQRMVEDIYNLKTEGLVTNNDVLRARLYLTDDSLSLNSTLDNIAIISYELGLLAGFKEDVVIRPDLSAWNIPLPQLKQYDEYLDMAFHNNPSVGASDKIVEASKYKVKIAKAENMPNIDFIAEDMFGRPYSGFGYERFNNHWSLGVSVSVPLSSVYKNRSNIHKAINEVYSSELSAEINMQSIKVKLKDAYLRHKDALNRVKTVELASRHADENYRIMKNRYLNQLAILTDLLDADALCLEARFQYITAKTEALTAYFKLKQLCGEL